MSLRREEKGGWGQETVERGDTEKREEKKGRKKDGEMRRDSQSKRKMEKRGMEGGKEGKVMKDQRKRE